LYIIPKNIFLIFRALGKKFLSIGKGISKPSAELIGFFLFFFFNGRKRRGKKAGKNEYFL